VSGVSHWAGSGGTYPVSTGHKRLTSEIEVLTCLLFVLVSNLFASDMEYMYVYTTFAAIVKMQSVPVPGRQDKMRGQAILKLY